MSGANETESGRIALVCGEGELESEKGKSMRGIEGLRSEVRSEGVSGESLKENVKCFTKILSVKYFT